MHRTAALLPLAALLLGTLVLLPSSPLAADGPGAPPAAPAPAPVPAPGPAAGPAAGPVADPAAALTRALQVEQGVVDALAKVRRHSVSVLNLAKDKEGNLGLRGVGSGVLVKEAGRLWVVTNVHVIAGNAALDVVTVDGARHRVHLEDAIDKYDFALLAFDEKPKGLTGVEIRASVSQSLAEGAWVLATGNPFFLALDGQPVCTLGVISGTDRILGGEYFYGNAIQHDAEVNPGNSGGPLWNAKGDLIGINGKIASRGGTPGAGPSNTGASFSIPIHQVAAFLKQLVKAGDAKSGFLGVDCETHADEKGNPAGARVTSVDRRSPAFLAAPGPKAQGLLKDDVITRITLAGKGFDVRTASDLTNALVLYAAATKVTITFRRGKTSGSWTGALGSGE